MSGKSGQIFVVNAGSSSIKATLFSIEKPLRRVVDLHLKKTNDDMQILEVSSEKENNKITSRAKLAPKEAFEMLFEAAKDYIFELKAVGHRFVHGGGKYCSKTHITKDVRDELLKLLELAPLHNPICLEGIDSALRFFGGKVPEWTIFDTAFHRNMPKVALNYAISEELASSCNIKRFGFHGISHAFLWKRYAHFSKNNAAKIITLHLGNGCSMSAIQEGVSLDTSMGVTPAEGLVMGSRAGDIDAAAVEIIAEKKQLDVKDVMSILNRESGLLGLSGVSSEMTKIIKQVPHNLKAAFSLDLFCYRIIKYIGSYLFALKGAQALIFSGGIGENAPLVRKKVLESLAWYGCLLDEKANESAVNLTSGEVVCITKKESQLAAYVIVTDENLAMAEEILE